MLDERLPTLLLFFGHDGVAERQEAEKLLNLGSPVLHRLHQAVVVEGKLGIGQFVPGEVDLFRFLQNKGSEEEPPKKALRSSSVLHVCRLTSVISTRCPAKFSSSPESGGGRVKKSWFPGSSRQTPALTVSPSIDGALVEGHDVLRQRSRLVAEDVFDLAQFLVERGGPGLGRGVALGVIHLPVPVDEEAVAQTEELHTGNVRGQKESDGLTWTLLLLQDLPDVEGNGHQRVEDDHVGPEGQEDGEGEVSPRLSGEEGREGRALLDLPHVISDGHDGTQRGEQAEDLMET